ncbi:MAG: SIMPL domain-containing protein [Paludibacteraceae bacterium]|nr:SIMPL domain-containing protein [Paludibacteraceae bacterium]
MNDLLKYAIIGVSVIISVIVLSFAITYYGRSRDVISVTGLGEEYFTSDQIVWTGRIRVDAYNKQEGYKQIAANQKKVAQYLAENGISSQEVTYSFVEVDKQFESVYNSNGNYAGSRFAYYTLSQSFTISSNDVDKVEVISREISSLISQGIDIESWTPDYYYSHLDDLKLSLIEKASKDARARAENIVNNAGAKLGKASTASLGVFQITSATGNDEYSYGGTFNTSSKEKKARITVRMSYKLK